MVMRTEGYAGIALVAAVPFVLVVFYYLGVISNLTTAFETVIIAVVPSMIVAGSVLLWSARKPSEQDNLRKQAIWEAIKLWVELPITRFRDKHDTLPLAEKPPELAAEIEQCLSRKYRGTVYACLQKFRQEYHEWKNTDSSEQFIKYEKGHAVLNYDDLLDWDDFKAGELARLHSQLVEQIKSEILAKHHTRLKC
jgi:hypothetical protein